MLSALQNSLVNIVAKDSKAELPAKLQYIFNTLYNTTYQNTKFQYAKNEKWDIANIEDEEIVEAYIELGDFAKSKFNNTGVLLILDDLGKFLEYAAMYPEHQDIYLLQPVSRSSIT